jgi:hypothetical protein
MVVVASLAAMTASQLIHRLDQQQVNARFTR